MGPLRITPGASGSMTSDERFAKLEKELKETRVKVC